MALEKKRSLKTESLAIRLDPKTRFMLDFIARLKGQTITAVVERAVAEVADKLYATEQNEHLGWRNLWSVSEGERSLNIAEVKDLFPTYEEEKRLAFAKEHWPFFYASDRRNTYLTHFVDILWPRIDEFVQLHDDQRAIDYFAAGRQMQQTLKAANIKAPDWPVALSDMDDIPF